MIKTYFLIAVLFIVSVQLNAQSKFKMLDSIPMEGNGGWDYITCNSGHLYISHGQMVQVCLVGPLKLNYRRGDIVESVIDTNPNARKLLGIIPDTKGVHGIAIASDLNKGFTSNGKDTSVTVFSLNPLQTITKIHVTGINPDAILYDEFSQSVFTFNGKTNNATVIDAKNNSVIATIPLEGKPEFSVSDGKGKVYVNIETKNALCVINSKTLKVEQTWTLAPCDEPTGLAIDNETHRLFSVCGNKMMTVLNAKNGKLITTLPIGDRCDGVVFNPYTNTIFTSNGEGTITAIKEENENSFKVIETIKTKKGARTIAIDNETGHLYLPTAEFELAPSKEENLKARPKIIPGTFQILEITPVN